MVFGRGMMLHSVAWQRGWKKFRQSLIINIKEHLPYRVVVLTREVTVGSARSGHACEVPDLGARFL